MVADLDGQRRGAARRLPEGRPIVAINGERIASTPRMLERLRKPAAAIGRSRSTAAGGSSPRCWRVIAAPHWSDRPCPDLRGDRIWSIAGSREESHGGRRGCPGSVFDRSAGQLFVLCPAGWSRTLEGFARPVTDRATFAYLCDLFVDRPCEGRGAGKALVDAILAHPDLQDLRRWMLVTRDAHGLYARHSASRRSPIRSASCSATIPMSIPAAERRS